MDLRNTLAQDETFMVILNECFSNNTKVALIVDNNGLERMEGKIISIESNAKEPYFKLDDGSVILEKSLIAINGMFVPSYSEC
jgi:hypothetical protein